MIASGTLVHTARYVPAVWRKWLRCWKGRGRGHIGEESRAHSCGTHGHSNKSETEGERSQKRDRVRTSDVYEKSGYQGPVLSENKCLKKFGMVD